MKSVYPYIFLDEDKKSSTYGLYSVMMSSSLSLDGYFSLTEATKVMLDNETIFNRNNHDESH